MTTPALPVDWKILRAATDDDETAMKELVTIYLYQGSKNVKKLRAAVEQKDPKQVTAVAHGFLGSSRFFGATQIVKPLAALVTLSRAHRLGPAAAQLVDQTAKEFVRINQFFKAPHQKPTEKPDHA